MSSLLALLVAAAPVAGPPVGHVMDAPALSDHELDSIRGARGTAFASGRGGLGRLARDSNLREFTVANSVMTQQFDNWFVDVAAPLVAANLAR